MSKNILRTFEAENTQRIQAWRKIWIAWKKNVCSLASKDSFSFPISLIVLIGASEFCRQNLWHASMTLQIICRLRGYLKAYNGWRIFFPGRPKFSFSWRSLNPTLSDKRRLHRLNLSHISYKSHDSCSSYKQWHSPMSLCPVEKK